MSTILLKIEEYEKKERFSLRDISKEIKLKDKQDKIDHYVLNRFGLRDELNISKEYIIQEFGLDYFFEHLENQVKIIKNTYVLSRYYEILWIFKNKMLNIKRNEEDRKNFIENTILSVQEKKIKDNYSIEHLLEKGLNHCTKREHLEERIFKELIQRGIEHKSAISVFNIVNKYKYKNNIMKDEVLKLVENEYKEFSEEEEYPHNFKDHLDILLKYYEKDSNKVNNLLEEVIVYFKGFEGDPMRATSFINELLTNKLIKNKKIDVKHIENLKYLSLKLGKNIKLHTIKENIEVSNDEMEKELKMFILNTRDKSIRSLLYGFLKVYEQIKEQTIQNESKFVFTKLFPIVLYDEKGRMVAQPKTEDEKSRHNFAQWSPLYFINFKKQLEAIFKEFRIDEKYFHKKIEISKYFDETDKIIVKKSIYYYFKSDYIIFLHLIIPRIENILRNFLEKQEGSSLGRIKPDGFKYKILGDLLEDPIITKIFTEDLIKYLKVVLTDDLGLNLRNDLSHGIITARSCNESNSNIIFHILLFILYI